jgi:Family 4 Glycosyltransferase in conflict systems
MLPRQDASRIVVPMSGHDRTDAEQWARAIDAVLYDRDAAFRRADALRTALASRHTWRRAVGQLLTSLGIAEEARSGT